MDIVPLVVMVCVKLSCFLELSWSFSSDAQDVESLQVNIIVSLGVFERPNSPWEWRSSKVS